MARSLVAIVWLSCVIAGAQPNPEAAAEFDAGRQAFASNDYALALRHFERAYELAPHDNARFNIGVCLERLGRFRDASLQYQAAARSETLDDAARARAGEDLTRVRARLATLHLRGRPSGASVEVAGTTCNLPCDLELDPGSYHAIVREPRSVEEPVTLDRGAELTVELDASAEPPPRGGHAPGFLSAIGTVIATIGLGGTIGFGVWTQDRLDHYYALPAGDDRLAGIAADGNLARDLTNVSIAVLGAGALLVAIDLLWWLVDH